MQNILSLHGLSASGLKASDKQALVDVTNLALENNDNIKQQIVNGFNGLNTGIVLANDNPWNDVINNIANIKIGKKVSSGIVTSSVWTPNTTWYNRCVVSGLSFTPSLIIVVDNTATSGYGKCTIYAKNFRMLNSSLYDYITFSINVSNYNGGGFNLDGVNSYVKSDGFALAISKSAGETSSLSLNWIAVE